MNKSCVIVIPVHSPTPTKMELMSLGQCFKILGKYDIKLLAPRGLDITQYQKSVPNIQTVFIDPAWQSDLQHYNKLKVSKFFYGLFKAYDFLLTYELDAYVFKDELMYWCEKGYDYIGAPWFNEYSNANEEAVMIGVGNSGFSLRSVKTSYNCAKRIDSLNRFRFFIRAFLSIGYKVGKKKASDRLLSKILGIKSTDQLIYFKHLGFIHEDYYYVTLFGETFKDVKIAPISDAIQFSFEANPSLLFKKNNNQLPFGCHAYLRYDKSFWSPIFKANGHVLDEGQ